MEISSELNPRIKKLYKLLNQSRERRNAKLFIVEGVKENELAISSGLKPDSFYIEKNIFKNSESINKYSEIFTNISSKVFEKLAYRKTTGGVLGVYEEVKNGKPHNVKKDNTTFVLLEGIEKPGNLGAILRTCDATKVDGVILVNSKVDVYSPNVIRSSLGTVFTNKIYKLGKEEVTKWINENNISLYATHLSNDSNVVYTSEFAKKSIFLFGTESTGITDFWLENAKEKIKIPMYGTIDSLNVSNSLAILLYENIRQKNFAF